MRRRPVQDSPELRRRRARRLLSAFVRLRNKVTEPVGVFDASYFEWMLRSGNPDEAHYYVERYLHRLPIDERVPSGVRYEIIAHVGVYKTLAKVVAGGEVGRRAAELFANPGESPTIVRVHKMISVMQANPDKAPGLWEILKPQALDVIMDLVKRCPDLQGEPRLPRQSILLCDAAPDGLLQNPGRRWKKTQGASADILIRKFLQKRLHMTQGRIKRSVCSRNASSQSAAKHMKKPEENGARSENNEVQGLPSNGSSFLASDAQI